MLRGRKTKAITSLCEGLFELIIDLRYLPSLFDILMKPPPKKSENTVIQTFYIIVIKKGSLVFGTFGLS